MAKEQLKETMAEAYIQTHEYFYKNDIDAMNIMFENKQYRYAIICGYYAIFNISKLYLRKKRNIRIKVPNEHASVQEELEFALIE